HVSSSARRVRLVTLSPPSSPAAPASPADTSPLSLHDALPILEEALPSLRQIAGNIAMAGFTAPKILWLKKHEPEHYARIAKVLRSEEHTSELQSRENLVCRLLLEKKKESDTSMNLARARGILH